MSPEQARHQPLDGRADLYATGVMLFEVFTSERLVDEQDQKTLWKRVLNPDHRAPRSVIPSLPASVDALIAKATATSPDDRFANAPSMLAAVSDIERELGSLGYGQRALVGAMKELYPNIPDYLPPMPDVSGVPADTSLIIASSKAKLRSVFGRGDLPVEGTLEFDRSSLPFAREEALAQAETVDMDGEEDTVTDVDDWPGVEALARVRRSLPRPPTQETDPSFVPPVRRTGSLVGSRIALQTVDRPPVPTPPSIEAEVCAPAEAPPATPSWTIALAVGGAVSLLGYLVWSTLT